MLTPEILDVILFFSEKWSIVVDINCIMYVDTVISDNHVLYLRRVQSGGPWDQV